MVRRAPKLTALLATVAGRSPVLIMTHDHPDPDALASAAALEAVLRHRAKVQCTVAYGGLIGRAENRALVQVLPVPVRPIAELDLAAYPVVAMVDCQHPAGNHALPRTRVPDIVFDHHPVLRGSRTVAFHDFRPRIGATCTMLCQYLFGAEVPLTKRLATAIAYGIKSETRDFSRGTTRLDLETFLRLSPEADHRQLAKIAMAPVGPGYYTTLSTALERARVYGGILVTTSLDELPNRDMAAEIADSFLRLDGVRCIVATGRFHDQLVVSVRTVLEEDDAGVLIRAAFAGRGSAGGHECMAAGTISLAGQNAAARTHLERDVVRAFRRAFHVTAGGGRRLVSGR